MSRPLMAAVLWLLLTAMPVQAQEPYRVAVRVDQLSRLFTELYGTGGLVVTSTASLANGQPRSDRFRGAFEGEGSQFGLALANELVSLPYPTPAAGFTYQLDPVLGVFTRTTTGFGPILSERAEAIGARRLSFGFAVQRLAFDAIEGLDLDAIPAVFTLDSAALRDGGEDLITTVNTVEATVTRSTAFISYGVTNRLDVSMAVPIVSVDMLISSDATIRRLGTTVPEIHFFRMSDDSLGDERIFTASGQATGIGDVSLRAKATLKRSPHLGVAVGVDVKLPTGDEMNLLGTGAMAVQPYAVWSASYGAFSPHVNAGYRWNGASVLGGGPGSDQARDLPDVVVYSAGGALAVHPRLTLAVDVLGRMVLDSPRLERTVITGLDAAGTTFSDIAFRSRTLNELSAATGIKLNIANRLLVNANLLFQLNADGLRAKISPLIGVEYAF